MPVIVIRKGVTLVELLVALPVAAIIGTAAVALLLDTQRLARRLQSTVEITRELRQAGAILAAELRPLSGADIVAWSDTSIEVHALTGSGFVCGVPSAATIDLLPLDSADPLGTSWVSTPQGGAEVFLSVGDSTLMPGSGDWQMSELQSVSTSSVSACSPGVLMPGGASMGTVVRLTLSGAATVRPPIGSLVRIAQRVRYSLYRSSDGLWYLGRKAFSAGAWTAVQPVAGPLENPLQRGLVVQSRDSANRVLTAGVHGTPTSIAIVLRSSSPWLRAGQQPGAADSVLLHFALRGQLRAVLP